MDRLEFVGLTVYMRQDVAEVSRVLQVLVRQPMEIERFNAHFLPGSVTHVRGLEGIGEPVMRLAIVGSVQGGDGERATKALNRLVSVFKVVVNQS